MITDDPREAAWDAVHEALPARWQVGPPTYDPGVVRADGQLGAFSVTARGPHPGRGTQPETVTGTGESEIEALRDLDGRLRPGVGFERSAPKTRKSVRLLRLPMIAQSALREQSRRQAADRLRAGRRWHDEGLIFTGENRFGGALSGATVVHALHRACMRSGLPRIRVHDLRHFYATQLGNAGLSDPTRMAVMGHASREMTDRYTHVSPTSQEASSVMDAVLGLGAPDAQMATGMVTEGI